MYPRSQWQWWLGFIKQRLRPTTHKNQCILRPFHTSNKIEWRATINFFDPYLKWTAWLWTDHHILLIILFESLNYQRPSPSMCHCVFPIFLNYLFWFFSPCFNISKDILCAWVEGLEPGAWSLEPLISPASSYSIYEEALVIRCCILPDTCF